MLPEILTHSFCCVRKSDSLTSTKQVPLLHEKDTSPPDCLLITTCGTSGIIAYILGSTTFHWCITGGCFRGLEKEICAEAITTDGKERLFVVDC